MGNLLGRFFLPHPPMIIPEVGKNNAKEMNITADSLDRAAKAIAEMRPDTVILLSEHGPRFNDHYYMPSQPRVSGDFADFGNKRLILGFNNDLSLAETVANKAKSNGISAGFVDDRTMKRNGIPYDLDHGITVPLYFISRYYTDCKILPISLSGLSGKEHYRFGIILRDAVRESGCNAVVIASGNLSHRLSANSPAGFSAEGEAFDKEVRRLLLHEDINGFLTFDPKHKESAAQCGLDVLRMLIGTLDGFQYTANILSYEAPAGIGLLAAQLYEGKAKESAFIRYLAEEEERRKTEQRDETAPLKLARYALTEAVHHGIEATLPEDTPSELLKENGGVFITLKNEGQLRGTYGTLRATQPTLAEEIIFTTFRAAVKDPFLPPIGERELHDIALTVDFIGTPVEIRDISELDPDRYGILVETRGKSAVILPGEPGVETAEDQVKAAKAKAGIHPWHRVKIKRFAVTRYE